MDITWTKTRPPPYFQQQHLQVSAKEIVRHEDCTVQGWLSFRDGPKEPAQNNLVFSYDLSVFTQDSNNRAMLQTGAWTTSEVSLKVVLIPINGTHIKHLMLHSYYKTFLKHLHPCILQDKSQLLLTQFFPCYTYLWSQASC